MRQAMTHVPLSFVATTLLLGLAWGTLASTWLQGADCNGNGVDDAEDVATSTLYFDLLETQRVGGGPVSLAAGLLDQDGFLDIATANFSSKTVSVLFNEQDGRFEPEDRYAADLPPSSIVAADLNQDGLVDLASVCSSPSSVLVLFNGGPGWFASPVVYPGRKEGRPRTILAADLNGDDAPDLVTTSEYPPWIEILFNRGRGTFDPSVFVTLPDYRRYLRSLAVSDLDDDGDLDLSVAAPPSVLVFFNQGDGRFADALKFAVRNPLSIVAADLDGDGDEDLATASGRQGLYILENLGAATFEGRLAHPFEDSVRSLSAGDFNGDGAKDLIVLSEDSLMFLNQGAGLFAPLLRFNLGYRPTALLAADIDGDGRDDLVSTFERAVSIHLSVLRTASSDCNTNGVPDECDVRDGGSIDCNQDGVPDECEPESRSTADCDLNGIRDFCQPDCNRNQMADACDISSGFSRDRNLDGIPDECGSIGPFFEVTFEGPEEVPSAPEPGTRVEARTLLHTIGLPPGEPGALGWALHVGTQGCTIVEATHAGTVAAGISDDPPGLFDDGFRKIELIDPDLRRGYYDGAALTAVVLSFTGASLDPGDSPHTVLRMSLFGAGSPDGCNECVIKEFCCIPHSEYVVRSIVTYQGGTIRPTFLPKTVRFCLVSFHRGDATGDGAQDITDPIAVFAYLFFGGRAPQCLEAADANNDGRLDIGDGIFVLNFLFGRGQPPPPPGPSPAPCAADTTEPAGFLGCERYESC